MTDQATQSPVVSLTGIARSFGAVKAVRGVDLAIYPGEVVGLVGHNGAGKSTLMNVLAGILNFDEGSFAFDRAQQHTPGSPRSGDSGIGFVSQEVLLAPNLSVAENTRILLKGLNGLNWRKRASALIADSLDAIFPGHTIKPGDIVGDMPIGRRQMVEIARAFAAADLKLMILDEPTSSLDGQAAEQLLRYVGQRSGGGLAVIFISHRLDEVLRVASRVVVMRDGEIVKDASTVDMTRDDLVGAMGHVVEESSSATNGDRRNDKRQQGPVCIDHAFSHPGAIAVKARLGEVVGLAGLAGRGQTALLHRLVNRHGIVTLDNGTRPEVAFVAGDRRTDGVFAVWSVAQNMTVRAMNRLRRFGVLDGAKERALAEEWQRRIEVRAGSLDANILDLSGGNQQKVLFARALASNAKIILMDDPMRGVDVGTKTEVYRLIHREAAQGRCFIWYTTEFEELSYCDRAYVFRDGAAMVEFVGDDINEPNVVGASFAS